ncbi:hypothetical protein FHY14_001112 [Xanthomonas arboricola]|nr:hypothetical protein [Xanthomonas arboricola]
MECAFFVACAHDGHADGRQGARAIFTFTALMICPFSYVAVGVIRLNR